MMAVLSVSERHQKSGVGNRLHLREKPFRVERSAGPATKPARRKKGRFSALLACSSCSRMMRPRGTPVSRAVCVSHSARSSGSLMVSVLLICPNCNTHAAAQKRPLSIRLGKKLMKPSQRVSTIIGRYALPRTRDSNSCSKVLSAFSTSAARCRISSELTIPFSSGDGL